MALSIINTQATVMQSFSGLFSSAFEAGMREALEKRALFNNEGFGALNALANINTLADMRNTSLAKILDNGPPKPRKKADKPRNERLKMTIDKELLAQLSPEQRKRLFFAVRAMRSDV